MGLPCIPFILLQLFMSLNACLDIKWAYLVFLSYFCNYSGLLMACSDIKWAYIVFLSQFCNYPCPLMHAWILNGLTLFSFHNFGIIHAPLCMLRY